MKNRASNFHIIFIVITILAGLTALYFINHYKTSKEENYFKENIVTLDIAFKSSLDKYSLFTKYIYDESINSKKVISLFEKGLNSKGNEKRLYKGLLYKELYPVYQRVKNEGIRQLHFHTKHSRSYIRFHKPSKAGDSLAKVRDTVKIANEEQRVVSFFETGRVISGFRNVFPLKSENAHLGTVEVSLSTKVMIDSIFEIDNRREYAFLLNKDIVLPKLFETQKYLYQTSVLNSDFLMEDRDSSLPDSPKKLSNVAKKINKKLSNNKELKRAMKNGEKYASFVNIYNQYYDVTLIPMMGVSNKVEGYLVAYKKSKNIPLVVSLVNYFYILVLLGMAIMIAMIFAINKKTKEVDIEKEWFKSISDGLLDGLYVISSDFKITYINPKACEILGLKEEEVIGKNAHYLFHSHSHNGNVKQEDCPIVKGVMNNNIYSSKEEFFLSAEGKLIPVSLHSRRIQKGNDYEIVTSFSDISIQRTLEEKRLLLTKALESSVNCIVITDVNAIVEWANPAFENLTGYHLDEIIGKDPKDFVSSGKQSKEFYESMWKTILSKKAWRGEVVNRKKDGTLYDEELIITPVLDDNDEIVNFIAVKQDITQRNIQALEKEEKDKILFQQSKMAAMGEMIDNIAHQWRQPLSAISALSTGTKIQKEMNILDDKDFENAMDEINNSAQYLSQTIEDFRGFFNPVNSKLSTFLISEVVDKTLKLMASQFKSNEIEIIKNVNDITIQSLENELIQVLINIINNAREALENKKSQDKFIFINTYVKKGFLIIEIKDNAGGIKEDIIDKVFDPYFTTKHQAQGTGIGLYMSHDIICKHLHGSLIARNDIYVYKNKTYKGAVFTIKIDLND